MGSLHSLMTALKSHFQRGMATKSPVMRTCPQSWSAPQCGKPSGEKCTDPPKSASACTGICRISPALRRGLGGDKGRKKQNPRQYPFLSAYSSMQNSLCKLESATGLLGSWQWHCQCLNVWVKLREENLLKLFLNNQYKHTVHSARIALATYIGSFRYSGLVFMLHKTLLVGHFLKPDSALPLPLKVIFERSS